MSSPVAPMLLTLLHLASLLPLSPAQNDSYHSTSTVGLARETYMHPDYDKNTIPVLNMSQAITIYLGLSLRKILEVDEFDQLVTMNIWVRLHWRDEYITWDPSRFQNRTEISVENQYIWRPDIALYSDGAGDYSPTMDTVQLKVDFQGNVSYLYPALYKVACRMDIMYFPFDQQTCAIQLGSWIHDAKEIDLQLRPNVAADYSDYQLNTAWRLINFTAKNQRQTYGCCGDEDYVTNIYEVTIRRHWQIHFFYMLIPILLIQFLAVLQFLLPCDSGEKVSLGITIYLSMLVYLLMVSEMLPSTEKIPLIVRYIVSTLIIVAIAQMLTIIVLVIHHNGSHDNHSMLPHWARVLFLHVIARGLCMSRYITSDEDHHERLNLTARHESSLELRMPKRVTGETKKGGDEDKKGHLDPADMLSNRKEGSSRLSTPANSDPALVQDFQHDVSGDATPRTRQNTLLSPAPESRTLLSPHPESTTWISQTQSNTSLPFPESKTSLSYPGSTPQSPRPEAQNKSNNTNVKHNVNNHNVGKNLAMTGEPNMTNNSSNHDVSARLSCNDKIQENYHYDMQKTNESRLNQNDPQGIQQNNAHGIQNNASGIQHDPRGIHNIQGVHNVTHGNHKLDPDHVGLCHVLTPNARCTVGTLCLNCRTQCTPCFLSCPRARNLCKCQVQQKLDQENFDYVLCCCWCMKSAIEQESWADVLLPIRCKNHYSRGPLEMQQPGYSEYRSDVFQDGSQRPSQNNNLDFSNGMPRNRDNSNHNFGSNLNLNNQNNSNHSLNHPNWNNSNHHDRNNSNPAARSQLSSNWFEFGNRTSPNLGRDQSILSGLGHPAISTRQRRMTTDMRRKSSTTIDKELISENMDKLLYKIYKRLVDFKQRLADEDVDAEVKCEWQQVAMVLDRLMFLVFLAGTVILMITMYAQVPEYGDSNVEDLITVISEAEGYRYEMPN